MSLLMQALKKAERAKQNSLSDEELEKPSEAYDQVLALAPADAMPPRPAAATAPVQTLSTLSLEPLGDSPAATPAPMPAPPDAPPAQPAQPAQPATAQAAGPQPGQRAEPPRARPEPPAAKPRASRSNTPPKGPTGPISVDPATVRLAVLLAVLLLVAGSMAWWYWRASTSPGAGASLPGVPMPLTDAPGAAAAAGPIVVLAAPGAGAAAADPSPQALPPELQQAPRQQINAAEQQALIQAAAQAAVAAQLAQLPPPAPPSLPPIAAPDNSQIQVLRTAPAPQIAPGVQQAYQALNGGQLGTARQQYEAVLQQDPANRDALLGLAAVALRENQGAQAASLYVRLLEINPDDGEALAGLIGLRQGDVVQSEAKLKAILARAPDSGPVLFALGNVYAKQRRWNEAQQQFFRAYNAVPGNPDYAFNLAVGLDRLNQPKLAATYYQRALALAQTAPAAFDRAVVQARLRELGMPMAAAPGSDPAIIIIRQE